MVNVCVLALYNGILASISDARLAFNQVNTFLTQSGKPALFNVQIAGLSKEIKLSDGLFSIWPDVLISDMKEADLIIIPALSGDMLSATYLNREYASWIGQQYKNGREVASLCSGAFLLAYSGILNGRQCTTHWQYANEFRYYYPGVKLVEKKLLTDENGIFSSGGGNAYWNLLLYLIEKYVGRTLAIKTAKFFVIDLERHKQSPFVVFSGMKDHDDELIKNAQDYIEHHFRDKLSVEDMASKFNVTRRTLERRFKKATFSTVTEYVQRVKIEAAKNQLELGRKTIIEIMSDIGYSDAKTFRDIFKKVTEITPIEYRNKYRKV